ncbi:MAG: RNA repair transcriptional activator RtcR family protein [Kiritimatiellae bacterium]|nr:RNA repair transcriptional activator RtcR family protein [Kiritimatiellia bacterium]
MLSKDAFLASHRVYNASAKAWEPLETTRKPLTDLDLWRPSVALAMYDELPFNTYYLLYDENASTPRKKLFETVCKDIKQVTEDRILDFHLVTIPYSLQDPRDSAEVYTFLYNLAKRECFHTADTDYYINCVHGTNAMRNCLFILTQEGQFNGFRIQPSPWCNEWRKNNCQGERWRTACGDYLLDDPKKFYQTYSNLRRNDILQGSQDILKGENPIAQGIYTLNEDYINQLNEIRRVAERTKDPILLTGPTGCGKTRIADNICQMRMKKDKAVVINCATLGGDHNMVYSTLFGCKKGTHSTAFKDTLGAFDAAKGGVLFLDEIGELDLSVQPILLKAIEERKYTPLGGSQKDTKDSDFLLVCGTNRSLREMVAQGKFRLDLLERINLWHFNLPGFAERMNTDLKNNCEKVLAQNFYDSYKRQVNFAPDVLDEFIRELRLLDQEFASSMGSPYNWPGNFREFNAIIYRMATLADQNLITNDIVQHELDRVRRLRREAQSLEAFNRGQAPSSSPWGQSSQDIDRIIAALKINLDLPPIERAQLREVIRVCRASRNQTQAYRTLYGKSDNNSSTLLRFLQRHGTSFNAICSVHL